MSDLTTTEAKDIVPFKAAIMTAEELKTYQEEMDGLSAPMFVKVTTPSGGSTFFEVPSVEDPEKKSPKGTLTGVVLHHHPLNRYYEKGLDERGNDDDKAPDCSSIDGRTAVTKEGECKECATCPLNEFGSGKGGKGKACSNRHAIYLLEDGNMLPTMIEAPPTSLRPLGTYVHSLFVGKRLRSSAVVTEVGLVKETSGSSQPYAALTFKYVGRLSEADKAETVKLGDQIKAYVQNTMLRRAPQEASAEAAFGTSATQVSMDKFPEGDAKK